MPAGQVWVHFVGDVSVFAAPLERGAVLMARWRAMATPEGPLPQSDGPGNNEGPRRPAESARVERAAVKPLPPIDASQQERYSRLVAGRLVRVRRGEDTRREAIEKAATLCCL